MMAFMFFRIRQQSVVCCDITNPRSRIIGSVNNADNAEMTWVLNGRHELQVIFLHITGTNSESSVERGKRGDQNVLTFPKLDEEDESQKSALSH